MVIFRLIILKMRNVWDKNCRETFSPIMAGTLIVYHWPMRSIKVKRYNYSIDTKNSQSKYESPKGKE